MNDISVYILKSFPFSRNGIRVEQAEASTTIDLPGRLFEGLNREGYVRRAVIGDGRVTLAPPPAPVAAAEPVVVAPAAVAAPAASAVVVPAPQPPAATSDLTEEELAALADGSWKDWRFFKQRSVAAKLSTAAIANGDEAKAAIEAYIAPKDIL